MTPNPELYNLTKYQIIARAECERARKAAPMPRDFDEILTRPAAEVPMPKRTRASRMTKVTVTLPVAFVPHLLQALTDLVASTGNTNISFSSAPVPPRGSRVNPTSREK